MARILDDLKSLIKTNNKVSGTVVGVLSSGALQIRTNKGVVNALPSPGSVISKGAEVIVDNGNVYIGLSSKREPKIYRV